MPGPRRGCVPAPCSKSYAHRLLICAALGSGEVKIDCGDISKDIAATARCLDSLCADISEVSPGLLNVKPRSRDDKALLRCGESGSTLRFLLPVCGALGKSAVFKMEGRLPQRPLHPLDELLRSRGMDIKQENELLVCSGKLTAGDYEICGNVSSQYVSGLLFALPLLDGDSTLTVTGKIESASYIGITEHVLRQSGISFSGDKNTYYIPGRQHYAPSAACRVEGDLSNAAFFLCMGAVSPEGICVSNIPADTFQGDRAIIDILRAFGADVAQCGSSVTVKKAPLHGCTVDASDIPDLVPVVSVLASAAQGDTRIINAGRLRLKESDRLKSTAAMLRALGGSVSELDDGLVIQGSGSLSGGEADSFNDHRIAMSAAVAACICKNPVKVRGFECTEKSFPKFSEYLEQLEMSK